MGHEESLSILNFFLQNQNDGPAAA
jgi:hypothetical protein